ncbi:MAG: ABC transporter ATP-binding protein, partial [Desulfobacterales bacterium]
MRSDFGYFEEDKLGRHYNAKILKRLYPFARPYKLFFLISIGLVSFITLLELSLPYVTKIAIDRYIVPASNSYKNRFAGSNANRTRYYKVALSDPEIINIVHRYPEEFRIDGKSAQIRFDALSQLEKTELVALRKSDLIGVGFAAGLLLILVLVLFGFNFFQVMIMEYSGQMIMHDLRMTLYDHIQGQALSFFTRHPVGRLVTRVTNDVQNMNELFTSVVVVVFKDLFLLAGIAGVLLSINWKLALLAFTTLPLVLYTSIKFSALVREAFRTLRIKIAEINTRFSETLEGMKIIQLFRQETENYTSFKKVNHEHYLAGMKQIHIFAVFMPIIEVFSAIAIGIVIFYGGIEILSGIISLGSLVAFMSYMRMFFRPIRDISEKYNIMQNAMASAERIFLVLDTKETLPQPALQVE